MTLYSAINTDMLTFVLAVNRQWSSNHYRFRSDIYY